MNLTDDELMKACRTTVAAWGAECLIDYAVTSLFSYYKDNPEEIKELLEST